MMCSQVPNPLLGHGFALCGTAPGASGRRLMRPYCISGSGRLWRAARHSSPVREASGLVMTPVGSGEGASAAATSGGWRVGMPVRRPSGPGVSRYQADPWGCYEGLPCPFCERRLRMGLITEKTPGGAALDGPAPCQGDQQQEKIEADGAGEPLVEVAQPIPDRRTWLTLGSGGCICHHAAGHEP